MKPTMIRFHGLPFTPGGSTNVTLSSASTPGLPDVAVSRQKPGSSGGRLTRDKPALVGVPAVNGGVGVVTTTATTLIVYVLDLKPGAANERPPTQPTPAPFGCPSQIIVAKSPSIPSL